MPLHTGIEEGALRRGRDRLAGQVDDPMGSVVWVSAGSGT